MFKVVSQTLAVNTIDFYGINLRNIGKHTFVLSAPHGAKPRGIVFKFQKGRIPQPGDTVHITRLADDESRVNFDREIVYIQRKHDEYKLRMICPPHLRLEFNDQGHVIGYALDLVDGKESKVNVHSLSW